MLSDCMPCNPGDTVLVRFGDYRGTQPRTLVSRLEEDEPFYPGWVTRCKDGFGVVRDTDICGPLDAAEDAEDVVNHPPHYTSHPSGLECYDITRHLDFTTGNAVKYLWRSSLKGKALEDLQKAEWYINRVGNNPVGVNAVLSELRDHFTMHCSTPEDMLIAVLLTRFIDNSGPTQAVNDRITELIDNAG